MHFADDYYNFIATMEETIEGAHLPVFQTFKKKKDHIMYKLNGHTDNYAEDYIALQYYIFSSQIYFNILFFSIL